MARETAKRHLEPLEAGYLLRVAATHQKVAALSQAEVVEADGKGVVVENDGQCQSRRLPIAIPLASFHHLLRDC